jgi:hypothetical protein
MYRGVDYGLPLKINTIENLTSDKKAIMDIFNEEYGIKTTTEMNYLSSSECISKTAVATTQNCFRPRPHNDGVLVIPRYPKAIEGELAKPATTCRRTDKNEKIKATDCSKRF